MSKLRSDNDIKLPVQQTAGAQSESNLSGNGKTGSTTEALISKSIEFGDIEVDLQEREVWLGGQMRAFQAAMNGRSLAESLDPLIQTAVWQTRGEARAAFYIVPPDGKGLHLLAGMSEEYAHDVNGFNVGAELMACGLARHTGKRVIIADIEVETRWAPFRAIARKHNYRGCWSFPVRTRGGPILGTFAMYFAQPRDPTPREFELADVLTHAAAIIISRYKESEDRVRIETALHKNEELLRLATAAGNLVSWERDIITDDTTISGDPRDIIGFGGAPHEAGWMMRIHPDDAERVARAMQHTLITKEPLVIEHRIEGGAGEEPIWVRVTARFTKDNRLIGITQNIDIQKKAELALRQKERKYRDDLEQEVKANVAGLKDSHKLLESIYNTTHVGITVFRPVHNQKNNITDFEIVIVNKKIEEFTSRTDLPGKLYAQEFPGVKKVGLFDLMVDTMKTGKPGKKEYLYSYDGINRWYSSVYVKTDDILVCSSLDLTEQKLTEEKNRHLIRKQQELEAQQQQQIFRAVLDTQEAERKRIAESLHNSLGQILYGAKLSLAQALKTELTQNDKQNLRNADKLLNEAITESRRLSHELMPVILEDFGLKIAVEDICRQLTGGTQFKCRIKGFGKRLDKYIEVAIYRIIQELMMNIVKHSEATEALVAVEIQKNKILILVQDNGRGFSLKAEQISGIGLKTIQNKVSLLNGSINMESKAGKGTVINIDVPYNVD